MITITFLIIILSSMALFIDYRQKKDKQRAAKACAAISAFLIFLNAIPPLYNYFFQEDKYTTKEETKRLKADIENLKSILSEPTQKEVESEIDKQFKTEFGKNKERALEEYQKGVSAYENNNFITAISHFKTAIKIFAIPSFYLLRGISYDLIDQFDQSISDYNKAIQLNPNYSAAYNNRGVVWGKKGDNDKAFADYNKAIQLNPNFAEAYSNRGIDYLLQGNKKLGCRDAQKACELGNCRTLEVAKDKGDCR